MHRSIRPTASPINRSARFQSGSVAAPPFGLWLRRSSRWHTAIQLTCWLLLGAARPPVLAAVSGGEERIYVESFDGAYLGATLNVPAATVVFAGLADIRGYLCIVGRNNAPVYPLKRSPFRHKTAAADSLS